MSREIMQQALDQLKRTRWASNCEAGYSNDLVIAALEAALAQPEQKLIGWKDGEPQYIEQPEPKSISTNDHLCAMLRQVHDVLACTALPMKRPWVGLTDDEVAEVERWVEFKEAGSGQIAIGKLVRYIELKLRSKNGG